MNGGAGSAQENGRRLRRRLVPAVVLTAALLTSAGALAYVAGRGPSGPRTMDERVHAVAETLKCPVCQDLSAADSPSGVARAMRQTIARDLRAGLTPDQIRARFVDAYGESILLEPPHHGLGLIAWILPSLLLALGAVAAAVAVRRWTAAGSEAGGPSGGGGAAAGGAISAADRSMLERELSKLGDEPE
jgi:cytochrome c-type biogenesis protein CcmH